MNGIIPLKILIYPLYKLYTRSIINSMVERSFRRKVDRYLRRENSVLAKTLKAISPYEGREYRESRQKRAIELVLATPLAISTLPLLAALATAKKLEDGGSCFYVQDRLDRHGNKIGVVKIRCMRENADADVRANLENAVQFGESKDPRNTRLGGFMRQFELEELPQLWQVVNGDLSLVDIRSAPQYVFDHLETECPGWVGEWSDAYFKGVPGVFSLNSAVNNERKDDTRRYHYDLLYSRKASLGLDMFVLYRTGLRMAEKFQEKVFSITERFELPTISLDS